MRWAMIIQASAVVVVKDDQPLIVPHRAASQRFDDVARTCVLINSCDMA